MATPHSGRIGRPEEGRPHDFADSEGLGPVPASPGKMHGVQAGAADGLGKRIGRAAAAPGLSTRWACPGYHVRQRAEGRATVWGAALLRGDANLVSASPARSCGAGYWQRAPAGPHAGRVVCPEGK